VDGLNKYQKEEGEAGENVFEWNERQKKALSIPDIYKSPQPA